MIYQTLNEVREAAETSEEVAIKSSIRHWKELATAPVDEIDSGGSLAFGVAACAICKRHSYCRDCPLCSVNCCLNDGSIYERAKNAWDEVPLLPNRSKDDKSYRDAAIKRYRRLARKMVRVLERLL